MTTILTQTISRAILVPTLVMAITFLDKAYVGAGDGFSGGVLAGAAVALQYLAFGPSVLHRTYPALRHAPLFAFGGLLLGLVTAFAPLLWGAPVLTHYPRPGEPVRHIGLLAFHTAVLFDVAVFCLVFGFIVTVLGLISEAREKSS